MKLSELFGKYLSSYDSWNGDNKAIRVENITVTDDLKEIVFSGKGNRNIYVPIDKVDQLIDSGYLKIWSTIDHCDIYKEIKFF